MEKIVMAGYPHEMGHAKEVWRKTTEYPELGVFIVLASIETMYLDPKEKGKPQWIAQVTFSMDMVANQQNSRTSGYLYHKWFDKKEDAINELLRLLLLSAPQSSCTVNDIQAIMAS
jgi:hypothetical protein